MRHCSIRSDQKVARTEEVSNLYGVKVAKKKRGDERRKKSFEDANYENPLSALLPLRRRNSPRSRLQTAPSGAPSSEFLCGQGIFFNSWVVLSYEGYRSS